MAAMALTTSKTIYREGFAPLMPGAFVAPYPYCLHCTTRLAAPDGAGWYKVRSVFYIVTGEPFKQSAELTGEPIKMKG